MFRGVLGIVQVEEVHSSSYKTTSAMGLRSHCFVLFSLNYLLKALSPNTVILVVRASTYEF